MATTPVSLTYNDVNYDITDLQYPSDLDTSEQYGQHRVVFFINVVGESKLRKNQGATATPVADIPPSEYKTNAGTKVIQKLSETTGAGKVTALSSTQKMKRLKAAISLYIPNDLNTSYTTLWDEEKEIDNVMTQLGADVTGGKSMFSSLAAAAGTKIAQALTASKFVQKAARVTQNTKKEQLFQGVDFRTVNFSFQFAPKNEQEAKNVLRIIRTFRYHMLPEFADENEFIYIYPSEFEIKYFIQDMESKFLERHFTAVLTNCNINYTPNGQFVTFEDGMPSQINMTLTFKELFLPSKESSSYKEVGK